MSAPAGEYRFSNLQRVIYGPGRVSVLPHQLGDAARVLLVTGRSLSRRTPLSAAVVESLGSRYVAQVDDVGQFAPQSSVQRVADSLESSRADTVVSLGGGSVIDTVKAAVHQVARQRSGACTPHIALPTTLSAAEFASTYGVTDDVSRRKSAGSAPELAPCVVILDAELTLFTPDWLWFGSGMRAIDHAVETVYAPNHNPISDATALQALRLLFGRLPNSGLEGRSGRRAEPAAFPAALVANRQTCQLAAWLSFFGPDNVSMGLSHQLGRKIGPRYSIPHGHTSAILLPHVLTEQAAALPERVQLIGESIVAAVPGASPTASRAVAELVERLGLPSRLRDMGVPVDELADIAGGDEIALRVLHAAW